MVYRPVFAGNNHGTLIRIPSDLIGQSCARRERLVFVEKVVDFKVMWIPGLRGVSVSLKVSQLVFGAKTNLTVFQYRTSRCLEFRLHH
jgi:hypothetical protein